MTRALMFSTARWLLSKQQQKIKYFNNSFLWTNLLSRTYYTNLKCIWNEVRSYLLRALYRDILWVSDHVNNLFVVHFLVTGEKMKLNFPLSALEENKIKFQFPKKGITLHSPVVYSWWKVKRWKFVSRGEIVFFVFHDDMFGCNRGW